MTGNCFYFPHFFLSYILRRMLSRRINSWRFNSYPWSWVFICGSLFFASSHAIAQSTAATASTEQQKSAGLDGLNEDRLLAELADRGLERLLERAFEINQVPQEKREGIRTLLALKELADPERKLSARQRRELVDRIVIGIEAALPSLSDPKILTRQAAALIQHGAEGHVNTLEYWGENTTTQAALRPVADTIIKLLNKAAEQAESAADEVANTIKSPNDPAVERWKELSELAVAARFTRHGLGDYYLALSMDRADQNREKFSANAIEYLKQFDNDRSNVQPLVRLRMGKLNMMKGDYAEAKRLFDSVADVSDEIKPAPQPAQQYEARYFSALSELFLDDTAAARKKLDSLAAWQKTTFADNPSALAGAEAAADMLRYRIHKKEAALSNSETGQKDANKAAMQALLALVRNRPEFRGIVYEQLMIEIPLDADFAALDTILLEAMIQKGEEQLKTEDESIDKEALRRAAAAARALVGRKDVDEQIIENATLLIPFFLERLERPAEAAEAFLDYIEKYPANQKNTALALDNAMGLIARLHKENPDDPATIAAYGRFLPIAIGAPFHRIGLAYEHARRLQLNEKFAEAIRYYRLVPGDDRRFLQARFFEMAAIKQQLDEQHAALDETARARMLAEIQALADQVNELAAGAISDADDGQERLNARSLQVRSALLAADVARRGQNDPKRALQLLVDLENLVEGIEGGDDLLDEALFIRVQSHMALGQNTQATEALVRLLRTQGGGEGARIVFNLLEKLNADLDKARTADDQALIRELAVNRAMLSGFLVNWAEKNPNLDIRKFTYRYRIFDAATQHLAAALEEDPAARKAKLQRALSLYEAMQSPENAAEYQQTLDEAVRKNEPDPAVMLGIGLIHYDLGNYQQSQQNLGLLLTEHKLGSATIPVEENGRQKLIDNDPYWEATYKLLRSNIELAKSDIASREALEASRNHLKKLYIRDGRRVGGEKWGEQFEALRKEIIPDFRLDDSVRSAPPATPP